MELDKDDYLKLCMYESLRIEAPVPMSSSVTLTEDSDIGGVKCKAGDMIFINIDQLHHNEDQWGSDHDTYRPERFEGKQKHLPYSFVPFLGGKRVCVGKTFAENSFKVVAPLILKAFSKLEFEDKEHYHNKPKNNIALFKRPEIFISLSQ